MKSSSKAYPFMILELDVESLFEEPGLLEILLKATL
jgi:hypothetical protein